MRRVLIIGNAGSGKTTFGLKLSAILKIPLIHLDKIYWNGNWEHIAKDDFDKILQTELEKESWIIDGNYNRTLPKRLQYCDTVFYFDVPVWTSVWGITERIIKSYGKTRNDMGGSCPEYFDRQKLLLYRNVVTFKKNHAKNIESQLKNAKNIEVITFRSRRQAKKYLNEIMSHEFQNS